MRGHRWTAKHAARGRGTITQPHPQLRRLHRARVSLPAYTSCTGPAGSSSTWAPADGLSQTHVTLATRISLARRSLYSGTHCWVFNETLQSSSLKQRKQQQQRYSWLFAKCVWAHFNWTASGAPGTRTLHNATMDFDVQPSMLMWTNTKHQHLQRCQGAADLLKQTLHSFQRLGRWRRASGDKASAHA